MWRGFPVVVVILSASAAFFGSVAEACTLSGPRVAYPLFRSEDETDERFKQRKKLAAEAADALWRVKRSRDYQEKQERYWDEARAVALVEIVEVNDPRVTSPKRPEDFPTYVVELKATLKGDGWFSDPNFRTQFAIKVEQLFRGSDCSLDPLIEIYRGEVGAKFVAYFDEGRLDYSDLISIAKLANVMDDRVVEAIADAIP